MDFPDMAALTSSGFAVDTHAHCYDVEHFEPDASSGFDLHANERGSARDYAAVLDAHGITHAVLVNPLGGYGTDNGHLLRTIAASGGRFRGIALLAEDADEATVISLIDGGVAGIRFNLNFERSPSIHGPAGDRALAIARDAGWIVQIHYAGDAILPALDRLASVDRIVIDHCGRPAIHDGIDQPGFAALLELGRRGRAYIKLSAFFRLTPEGAPYARCDDYVEALIEAFSIERCLWGSDWPFVRASRRVDYVPQLAYLARLISDQAARDRILWDNPAQLFGFEPAQASRSI
jgi:predicted TIM-barrel fold metal-dependent hydrolase